MGALRSDEVLPRNPCVPRSGSRLPEYGSVGSRVTYVPGTAVRLAAEQVEVDTQTGEVVVLRMVSAHDSGVVINPPLLEGQIAGGIAQGQGLGMALSDEVILREGRTLNPSLISPYRRYQSGGRRCT